MIRVRLPASSGLITSWIAGFRVEVPCISAPKRSAASGTPIAEFRPRSATAIPMKPICETWMSRTPSRNCQPRMSIAPARPANVPGDRHRQHVAALDVDAAVPGGLRVEAGRAHLVAERRPVEDQPVDDRRAERDEEADVQALEHRVAPEHRQMGLLDDVRRDRHGLVARVLELAALADRAWTTQYAIQLSMIVEITSWTPTVAFRKPAIAAQAAPARRGEDDRRGRCASPEDMLAPRGADPRGDEGADDVLALAADVEEAALERERDGEAGQDQRRSSGSASAGG